MKQSYVTFVKQPIIGDIAKRVYRFELLNDWNAQKNRDKNMKIILTSGNNKFTYSYDIK